LKVPGLIISTALKLLFLLLFLNTTACQTTRPPTLPSQSTIASDFSKTAVSTLQNRTSWQNKHPLEVFALSPSGEMLALGGQQNIQMIDTSEGNILQNFLKSSGDTLSLAFSPDATVLAAGSHSNTTLWLTQNGQKLATLKGKGHDITALAFSPDGQKLATGSVGEQTEITIWNIKTLKQEIIQSYDTHYADRLQTLVFSPDSRYLAAAGRDQRVRIWRMQRPLFTEPPIQTLHSSSLNPAIFAFSPDLKTLALGTAEGPILLYDWRSGKIMQSLNRHQGPIHTLAFQDNGRILLSTGQDQILRHWQLQSGMEIKTETLGPPAEIFQISQNASTLVAQGLTQTHIFAVHSKQQNAPKIIIHSPESPANTFEAKTRLIGSVVDVQGIAEVSIQINNLIWTRNRGQGTRDLTLVEKKPQTREVRIDESIPLRAGENTLTITARNVAGHSRSTTLKIHYTPQGGKVWAAVIGISEYQHVPGLKYADDDAQAFYDYLINDNQIPKNQVTLLLNEAATLQNLRDLLGVELRKKARKQDTVIIYYAGHGAPEPDRSSEDGDGLEKYLLPYDADPTRLYSTALPMSEIARIFPRLAAERVVMLQDTCFSGATGLTGRTIQTAMFRASISDHFLNRLTQGKGRIIITASEANEVSLERDDFGHGVFTYFLLEALRHGDRDGDGFITTTEAFRYVSEKVPAATGQTQHPVKKGIESAEIILGRVRTGK